MKNLKKLREEYGAGEWGTPELTQKFKSETPGQDLDEAKGADSYSTAANDLSVHAMKSKSALAHRKAADAHTEASAAHTRKVDKLVKSGASQEEVSHHEAQVKMHDQNAQRHRLHSLRFHALGMKESTDVQHSELSKIHHEYKHLKSLSTPEIHAKHKGLYKVVAKYTPAEVGGKQGMIDDIMHHRHGEKRMGAYHALPQKNKDSFNESAGTVSESSVEDHEASMAFHHEKAQEAKAKGDNEAYERHLNIKHQHAIERDKLNLSKQKRAASSNLAKQKDEAVQPSLVKEDAASAASSAASALSLAARDPKSHSAAAEAHKKAAAALHKKREDSAEDRTMSKDQHATLKHRIDRHLKQAAFHSSSAGKTQSEGWEMPLPVEPESGVQHTENLAMDDSEGDDEGEGQMAKYQLEEIAEMASKLAEQIEDDDQLEAWVQEKITTAYNSMDDVYSYAESQEEDDVEDETPEGEDEMDYPETQTEAYHIVGATVTDPNHTMVTKRKEAVLRHAKIKADSKEQAVTKAWNLYQKKGYKVHDVFHHSQVNEAATEVENSPEEKQERMRLETLIRLGLLDRALLPVVRRSMKKLESGQNITATVERAALFDLLQQLVGIVTGDDTIFRKVRLDVSQNKSQ